VLVRTLKLILTAVKLLVLARAAREEDKTLAVGLEARDVKGERFLRQVLATGVEGDADGGGEFAGDAGFL
jgi:hypothetical protein